MSCYNCHFHEGALSVDELATNEIECATRQDESRRSVHDLIYSALLGAVMFFTLISVLVVLWIAGTASAESHPTWPFYMLASMYGSLLLFELVVLIIRIRFPNTRKWPTVALNVVLLLFFPFGTLLAVYGLWKADRLVR